jgi:hypothetical protein
MSDDDEQRTCIAHLLADGLPTRWAQRAYTAEEVFATCQRLQQLDPADVAGKLVEAGFTATPYVAADDEGDEIEQACATCMYYERHRCFCALPELMLPVDAQWSCILWRI